MAVRVVSTLVVSAACLLSAAQAAETDQYLVWGVELDDSATAVNAWLNDELRVFLDKTNSAPHATQKTADELAVGFMRHVFSVRPFAKINELYDSGELDEYPPREDVKFIQYQRMSIYRGPAFPFVLFMARTIRIGDVYLGIDKLSHLFGFGRRYFVDYLDLEKEGLSEEAIEKRLIEHGLRRERWLTGRAVNGVISPSDLEANYQGLRFARNLCRGADPVLAWRDGRWVQTRKIDIVPFITPQLDESYYRNRYWAARKRHVLPVIEKEYAPMQNTASVQARFRVYDRYAPSFNVDYLETLLASDPDDPLAAAVR